MNASASVALYQLTWQSFIYYAKRRCSHTHGLFFLVRFTGVGAFYFSSWTSCFSLIIIKTKTKQCSCHLRFKSEPEIQYWQNRHTGGACMGVMVVWRTLEWLKLGLSLAGQHDWVFYPVLWPIQLGGLSQRERFVQHQPEKPKHAQSDSDQQTNVYTKHVNKKNPNISGSASRAVFILKPQMHCSRW